MFNVRIFGYAGLSQLHISQQRTEDRHTVWMAEEPPLWSATAPAEGTTPVLMAYNGSGPDMARVLGIEIPEGFAIRYELMPLGPTARNVRVPGNESRRMTGFDYILWNAGAVFAFVDAAEFP